MVRILHLADLHLGHTPVALGPRAAQRQAERDRVLQRAVDYALSEAVDLVVIAGDLFDHHCPEAGVAAAALAELQRLVAGGVGLVTVPGHHDGCYYPGSIYRRQAAAWPGTLVIAARPVGVTLTLAAGKTVHVFALACQPGLTPKPLSDLPSAPPEGYSLFVAHAELGEGTHPLQLDPAALDQAGYTCALLGGRHAHAQLSAGRTQVVYAGAVEGLSVADPGTGHFTLVELGAADPVVAVPTAHRAIRSETLDLDADAGPAAWAAAICERGDPEAMVRITLQGQTRQAPDLAALAAEAVPHFFHLELADATHYPADLLQTWAGEPTVRGHFVRRMLAAIEAADAETAALGRAALKDGLQALDRGVAT